MRASALGATVCDLDVVDKVILHQARMVLRVFAFLESIELLPLVVHRNVTCTCISLNSRDAEILIRW